MSDLDFGVASDFASITESGLVSFTVSVLLFSTMSFFFAVVSTDFLVSFFRGNPPFYYFAVFDSEVHRLYLTGKQRAVLFLVTMSS